MKYSIEIQLQYTILGLITTYDVLKYNISMHCIVCIVSLITTYDVLKFVYISIPDTQSFV